VVSVDGRVRPTRRLRDQVVRFVEPFDVVDLFGVFKEPDVLLAGLLHPNGKGNAVVVEFLDVDVERRVEVLCEVIEYTGLLLLEVNLGLEHLPDRMV